MKILGIIPARYASTRFPGKPLADISGKSMIWRVYEQARQVAALQHVVVATDDERIRQHVLDFGGQAVLTSPDHPSGTDRCYEALQQIPGHWDYVVNIQGDEPFIQPEAITQLTDLLDGTVQLATLVMKITDSESLFDPNKVRVVRNVTGEALLFSRQAVPYLRGVPPEDWLEHHIFYRHLGLYAYRTDVLAEITQLQPSSLEKAESLEQLRWLENGYRIQTAVTEHDSLGIDTPQDLQRALQQLLGN